MKRIEKKLQKPSTYKNTALVAHQHFLTSLQILEEMQKSSEKILEYYHTLAQDDESKIQTVFSLSEIKDNLHQQYRSLKSQQETSEDRLSELRKKVIRAVER